MIRSLVASVLVVFALSLGALAFQVGQKEKESVESALEAQLVRDAALLAALAPDSAIAAGDRAAVDAWADEIGAELEHRVTAIAGDGAASSGVRRRRVKRASSATAPPYSRSLCAAATPNGPVRRKSMTGLTSIT